MGPVAFVDAIRAVLLFASLAPANDLNTYTATYEKKLEEIILSHGMVMSDVNRQYTEALAALRAGTISSVELLEAQLARVEKFKQAQTPGDSFAEIAQHAESWHLF